MNEIFHYVEDILKYNKDVELDDWIEKKTYIDLYHRLKDMCFADVYKEEYEEILFNYVKRLSDEETTLVYWKFNLYEFTLAHPRVRNLYHEIFKSISNEYSYAESVEDIPYYLVENFEGEDRVKVDEYNRFVSRELFIDPNNPPDSIKESLDKLTEYYMKYVYHPIMSIDRIFRLKYFVRKTVCVVDTDSNILAMDLWVDFCTKNLLHGDYDRPYENNCFIMINTIANFITTALKNLFFEYGDKANIPEDYRDIFSMKNEYYFSPIIIGRKKKRYMSAIKLREGNLISPYKMDIKGFEFIKATTSENVVKVFKNIIKEYILEKEKPDIQGMLRILSSFEDEIRLSIQRGERTYLPIANFKDLEAYKDPYSQPGMRGGIAWNLLYPNNEITPPSKVGILKLNIFTLDDISGLQETYPDIYRVIKNDIFGSREPKLASKGLQVLSIPDEEMIPEWCDPYIDYNTIINNIIGSFKGVLDTFGIESFETGKTIKGTNRKSKKFSNIVKF